MWLFTGLIRVTFKTTVTLTFIAKSASMQASMRLIDVCNNGIVATVHVLFTWSGFVNVDNRAK